MNIQNAFIVTAHALASLDAGPARHFSPHIHEPAPEKYPGQRQSFRRGAWAGDGFTNPPEPGAKATRIRARRADDRRLWEVAGLPHPWSILTRRRTFLNMKHNSGHSAYYP